MELFLILILLQISVLQVAQFAFIDFCEEKRHQIIARARVGAVKVTNSSVRNFPTGG